MKIEIPGYGPVDIKDLKADVKAAEKKGLVNQWSFTPETVQGLIDKVEELEKRLIRGGLM